jgi:hypothetical protein
VKAKETNKGEKPHAAKFSFPCGDFQKIAEMMKHCCPAEGDITDCCSMMRRMTGQGKGAEAKETKKTQK